MKEILSQLIDLQKEKMRRSALSILVHLTEDDLLQPNDFPQLERSPYFRYEEGVLEGLMTARAAYLAYLKEKPKKQP